MLAHSRQLLQNRPLTRPLRRTPDNEERQHMDYHPTPTNAEQSAKTLTTVIYALYAAAFLLGGVTAIAAIVINYVKKDEVAGTWLASHFRWQIRTFWFGLLWGILGTILLLAIVGWFILIANAVWVIYRIVKGWLNLNDGKPMYETAA